MKQSNGNTIYTAALYLRLSKDDGFTDRDSGSVDTQHEMLTRFCRENNIIVYDYYIDDGFSGTNFERPSFKRMIEDIENKNVNCVITKDQSRLGRNHLESGFYMEVYFPEHNVRYIAVTDNVDTLNSSTLDIAPFRNLLNDMYAQDVSKKIKSAFVTRQKQGKFIGTKAPYGYMKDPNDKNHLIIDERYAPIIRMIFQMSADGYGVRRIRNYLIEQKIPRPAYIAMETASGYGQYISDDESIYQWTDGSIRDILRNPVYAGHIRGQKRPKISHKSNKRKSVSSAGTFVVKNVHEPIIEPEKWEIVQRLIDSRRRERKREKFDNFFCGLLRCADCGYSINLSSAHRKNRENVIDMLGYQCSYYRNHGKEKCTQHWVEARDLYDSVLEDIRKQANKALSDDEKMVAEIIAKLDTGAAENIKRTEKELRKAKTRLAELDRFYAVLYEGKVSGNISERNFKQLSTAYETEQIELERMICEYEQSLHTAKEHNENADVFVNMIKDYSGITELTSAVLNTLIDKIVIHESEIVDGEKVQNIEIFYKFVGNI